MRRAAVVLLVGLACAVCASRAERKDDTRLLHGVEKHAADGGHADVNATVELAFGDGGGALVGAYVTVDQDAPDGVHLRLALKDAAGKPTVTDRLVALCAVKAMQGERVFVPLDPSVLSDVTLPVASADVTFASRVGGCLRPTLRMETLVHPAGKP